MKRFIDWLLNHGTGLAFTFILMVSLSVIAAIMFVAVAVVFEKTGRYLSTLEVEVLRLGTKLDAILRSSK